MADIIGVVVVIAFWGAVIYGLIQLKRRQPQAASSGQWGWPQVLAVMFAVGFIPSLRKGLGDALLLGVVSAVVWGPITMGALYFMRRRKNG